MDMKWVRHHRLVCNGPNFGLIQFGFEVNFFHFIFQPIDIKIAHAHHRFA